MSTANAGATRRRMRALFGRSRFAIYGLVAGASLVTMSLVPRWPSVLLPGLLLCLTLAVTGLDLQRSLLARVGRVLVVNARLAEGVGGLRAASTTIERRLEVLGGALHELTLGVAQTRAAAERSCMAAPTGRGASTPHVLFVTSNGSGMGHLTRLTAIAIAGRGRFESTFLSLSSAAEVAALQGFDVMRMASQQTSGLSWPEWNRRFSERFDHVLEELQPQLVVFDGIRVFRGVYERARHRQVPLVWVCRGLWKRDVDVGQVRSWRDIAEVLILPTEGALVDAAISTPQGVVGGLLVPPIVHPSVKRVVTRDEALKELGLNPERRHVLIQLGSGALVDRTEWLRVAGEAVHSLGPDWQAVQLRSPLADPQVAHPEDAVVLYRYPVASYLSGFEFSITAAGYNTVHEHIALGHPAVYIPDQNMLADDQVQRANLLVERGAGLAVEDLASLPEAVEAMATDKVRQEVTVALRDLRTPSGAEHSAAAIAELAGAPQDALAPVWFRTEKEC